MTQAVPRHTYTARETGTRTSWRSPSILQALRRTFHLQWGSFLLSVRQESRWIECCSKESCYSTTETEHEQDTGTRVDQTE